MNWVVGDNTPAALLDLRLTGNQPPRDSRPQASMKSANRATWDVTSGLLVVMATFILM